MGVYVGECVLDVCVCVWVLVFVCVCVHVSVCVGVHNCISKLKQCCSGIVDKPVCMIHQT